MLPSTSAIVPQPSNHLLVEKQTGSVSATMFCPPSNSNVALASIQQTGSVSYATFNYTPSTSELSQRSSQSSVSHPPSTAVVTQPSSQQIREGCSTFVWRRSISELSQPSSQPIVSHPPSTAVVTQPSSQQIRKGCSAFVWRRNTTEITQASSQQISNVPSTFVWRRNTSVVTQTSSQQTIATSDCPYRHNNLDSYRKAIAFRKFHARCCLVEINHKDSVIKKLQATISEQELLIQHLLHQVDSLSHLQEENARLLSDNRKLKQMLLDSVNSD